MLRDGEVHVVATASPADDPALVLAAARSRRRARHPHRPGLARPSGRGRALFPDPWPAGARDLLALRAARRAATIGVLEALDHKGPAVADPARVGAVRAARSATPTTRTRSTGTCARRRSGAADLADRVGRPDLLVIGTLLHDIGTYPATTPVVGQGSSPPWQPHDFPPADVDTLVLMVRHHLLLPTSPPPHLGDDATIERVAEGGAASRRSSCWRR